MNLICPICSSGRKKQFNALLLHRYKVDYFFCSSCGFLQTEKPYWLEEAYSAAIASADTGLVVRNFDIAQRLSVILYFLLDKEAIFLDTAGGTGLLTRMMRDIGFDFRWRDSYCENIHAVGFELIAGEMGCEVVTAFEVMEHLEDPIGFVANTLKEANADTFIFTTEVFEGLPPAPGTWPYYVPETGQHISFFQLRTLELIAGKLGMKFFSAAGMHMFTLRNFSPMAYNVLAGRLARLFIAPVVKRLMPSKTILDHERMLSRVAEPKRVI